MHEWRKQVKCYWHVLEVFKPVRPALIGRAIGSAKRLADWLGEEHDLALLAAKLQESGACGDEPLRTLIAAIERRRRNLRRKALRKGAALYADSPTLVEKRLRQDWRKWRNARPTDA
jgi:CHAD domain-containing protein